MEVRIPVAADSHLTLSLSSSLIYHSGAFKKKNPTHSDVELRMTEDL